MSSASKDGKMDAANSSSSSSDEEMGHDVGSEEHGRLVREVNRNPENYGGWIALIEFCK